MADVLSSGRDPGRRRRLPPAALALLAVLLTAAVVTGYRTGHRPAHPRGPSAPPAAAILPVRTAKAHPPPPAWLRCGLQCDASVLHASTGRGPRGLRLLLNTTPPTVLDDTGRQRRGPPVPLLRREHIDTLLRMGVDAAVLVQSDYVTEKTPHARIYRIGADGSVALIGRADAIVQGIGATLWTVTYPPQSASPGGSEPAPYTLTEIDRTGRVLARYTEPQNIGVIRATKAGLLVTLPNPSDGSYFRQSESVRLLDPATGKLRHGVSGAVFAVLDVTDDLVAWSSTRSPLVEVYDLSRGAVAGVYNAPGYHPPNYGRFSPDQHTLALGFAGLPQLGSNPASYGYLETLDLTTGRITRINGLRTPPKNNPQLDWTPDSRTLILSVDQRDRAQIALWQQRNRALSVLPNVIDHSEYVRLAYLQRVTG